LQKISEGVRYGGYMGGAAGVASQGRRRPLTLVRALRVSVIRHLVEHQHGVVKTFSLSKRTWRFFGEAINSTIKKDLADFAKSINSACLSGLSRFRKSY
jgi:hypothetical protein